MKKKLRMLWRKKMKSKFNDTFYVPVVEYPNGNRQFVFDSHGKVRNYASIDAVKKNMPKYQHYDYIYVYKIADIMEVKNENY